MKLHDQDAIKEWENLKGFQIECNTLLLTEGIETTREFSSSGFPNWYVLVHQSVVVTIVFQFAIHINYRDP